VVGVVAPFVPVTLNHAADVDTVACTPPEGALRASIATVWVGGAAPPSVIVKFRFAGLAVNDAFCAPALPDNPKSAIPATKKRFRQNGMIFNVFLQNRSKQLYATGGVLRDYSGYNFLRFHEPLAPQRRLRSVADQTSLFVLGVILPFNKSGRT